MRLDLPEDVLLCVLEGRCVSLPDWCDEEDEPTCGAGLIEECFIPAAEEGYAPNGPPPKGGEGWKLFNACIAPVITPKTT